MWLNGYWYPYGWMYPTYPVYPPQQWYFPAVDNVLLDRITQLEKRITDLEKVKELSNE